MQLNSNRLNSMYNFLFALLWISTFLSVIFKFIIVPIVVKIIATCSPQSHTRCELCIHKMSSCNYALA